jgi:hypothetical protein
MDNEVAFKVYELSAQISVLEFLVAVQLLNAC